MSGPFLSSTRRRRDRRRRVVVALVAVLLVLGLLAAAFGGLWLLGKDEVPARTTIAGIAVGGLSVDAARARLVEAADAAVHEPITIVAPGGAETTSGAALRARPEVEEALAAALEPGTFERMWRGLGFGAHREVALRYALGPVRVAELANRLDERFADRPRDADVRVEGTTVRVVEAVGGTGVDRGALRRSLATLPRRVVASLVPAPPRVSTDQAEAAAARVERLVSAPRVVRYRGVDAPLSPKTLGGLVRTEPGPGALVVTLDARALEQALRPRLGRFEVEPRDATFAPSGSRVRLVPARDGRRLDGDAIGSSLVKNIASTAHLARFTVASPALTTEAARRLGIVEQVSEFTTYHPCCAPRVTNIHRAADILRGTIVRPGQRFSLNEALGKRTEERGFVAAPQIFNGRLEDAVGGGVSQIATTMYNAAFFAGVELVAHQPHEFYISRYPMGREATVSWGGPELIWRNDWPAAIYIDTSYTDTSITIRFYSRTLGRKVTTETGEPCCSVPPRTITVSNPSLPPGTTQTVQDAGPSGFTISYTRKVLRNGELRRDERFTWRYKPENAIVEVGPPKPVEPKPKPGAKPTPGATKPEGAQQSRATVAPT